MENDWENNKTKITFKRVETAVSKLIFLFNKNREFVRRKRAAKKIVWVKKSFMISPKERLF